ncbi:MAG TPA: dihydroneopterin aldolase [Flavobacteriaceae bacterium]|nr:dihydroneopterin aldolase [Flavobacteriaceae bacterium]
MGIIRLNNIRCYAYHGCMTEEAKIGSDYRVDLWVRADFTEAAKTDKLNDTIDYVKLNKLVKTQMTERSNLLEQVVQRMIDQVLQEFPTVMEVGVALSKINPPLGGDVESVTVELTKAR